VRSSPISTVGTSTWYIQSGSAPWSGIWVAGPDSILAGLRLGDSVTVTGTVQENFDVTRLFVSTTPAVVHATGRPLPAPVTLLTSSFSTGVGNGSISAEPYEGMLVTFRDVVVTNTAPTFADPTEYEVGSGDGSQPIIVRRDGKNTYTNLPADTVGYPEVTLLRLGDRLSSLTGIIYYSSRRYNIVPRGNTDFGTVTTDIEILRTDDLPPSFVLEQNFPNPFNPTTSIRYQVAAQGAGAVDVRLVVFDMLGREVAVLVQERQMPGHYEVRFAAERLPSGVYFYRLQAGSQMLVRKMMLLK
jgi:hypothetical protein